MAAMTRAASVDDGNHLPPVRTDQWVVGADPVEHAQTKALLRATGLYITVSATQKYAHCSNENARAAMGVGLLGGV